MYRKSKRSRVLVGKNGVISKNSKKNVNDLIEQIKNMDRPERDKLDLINDLEARVLQAHVSKNKLTVNGFFAKYEKDKIHRMLVNAGYTAQELADEIGVSEEDILNSDN